MKTLSYYHKYLVYFILFSLPVISTGQINRANYNSHIKEADSLLIIKAYLPAASRYTDAFRSSDWKGMDYDRYSAARAWAMAGVADSAFFQLEKITAKAGFDDLHKLENDPAFDILKLDNRWPQIVLVTKKNGGFDERYFDKNLFQRIDSLKNEDQKWRNRLTTLKNAAAKDSTEISKTRSMIARTDSLNYYYLQQIIQKYGFPNADKVTKAGSHSFWLLIQHQDMHPGFQDSVLRLMEKEVAVGKASGQDYAYLVDRVLLNTGKSQLYGTQMTLNADKTSYEPRPVTDPAHLNERRQSVGLTSIETYIEMMNTRYFGTLKKQ